MKVLVLAPHPDDEAIGCGGTLLLRAAAGDDIHVAFLTSGEAALKHLTAEEAWRVREAEAEAAAAILGVSGVSFLRRPDWMLSEDVGGLGDAVLDLFERLAPAVVYVPHPDEWHPDHRAAHQAACAAAGRCGLRADAILGYEVWTPMPTFDQVEDVTSVMESKVRAVASYRSQNGAFDYVRAVNGLNQYRGALAARSDYAEVFDRCPEELVPR